MAVPWHGGAILALFHAMGAPSFSGRRFQGGRLTRGMVIRQLAGLADLPDRAHVVDQVPHLLLRP
jgi:hypothetical protein